MNERDDSGDPRRDLTVSPSQVLATRSASLLRRSLASISNTGMASVLMAAKRMMPCHGNVFDSIREEVTNVLHPDRWALLLRDLTTDELFFEIATDGSNDPLKAPWKLVPERLNSTRIKVGRGITGSAAEAHEPVVISDVRADSRFVPEIDGWSDVDVTSIVAVPLRAVGPVCMEYKDRCVGLIELINYADQQGMTQTDLAIIEEFVDFATIAIGNSRHLQEIHALTITDETTGLYNLRHLNFMLDTEIYRSERYGYEFSLVAIDSGLRSLSTSLTYDGFNRLLADVASVVKAQCRLIDFAFRYDVGEFMLLLPQTTQEKGSVIAQRTANLLTRANGLSTTKLHPVVASVAFPLDGKTKLDLLAKVNERVRSPKAIRT